MQWSLLVLPEGLGLRWPRDGGPPVDRTSRINSSASQELSEPAGGRHQGHRAAAEFSREGAEPRHIAFHPANRLAYIVNELDSTVSAYRFDPQTGVVTPFQIVSTLPDTYVGNSQAAEIAVSCDGRFVYGRAGPSRRA